MGLKLYSYWRAAGPYRVRIGLALKGLAYDYAPVHLLEGAQHSPDYKAVNRQSLTPALDIGGGTTLTQSVAILEWLDETYPDPAILPKDALGRQRVRAMTGIVASDIQPINNLRILRALSDAGVGDEAQKAWIARWIGDGFTALEAMIAAYGAGFSYGDAPTIADCVLIPQVYSARRYKVDLSPYPAICAVAERAEAHPAFVAAHPDRQPDALSR